MNNLDLLWRGALRPFSLCILAYVLRKRPVNPPSRNAGGV